MTRILLVEDDTQFRTMLTEVLTRAGYQVQEAANGKEGIKLFASQPPDLVITDLVMPEKEGLDMIMELKRLHTATKIIAISGGSLQGSANNLRMAQLFGATRVLGKPFSHQEILEAVSEVLQEN